MTPDEAVPVIYIFHGDDEFSIAQHLAELESKIGVDPATAAMNITRLDGKTADMDQLLMTACALPFLARRRMVVLNNPFGRLGALAAQKKFLAQLEKIPPTTAFIITEEISDKEWAKNTAWLGQWVKSQGSRVYSISFQLPKGSEMSDRIRNLAQKKGGGITRHAAELLGDLVDGDPRMADQEIQKLLAYVNYQRPIEADDVQALTVDVGQGDIFDLVEALGDRNGRKAMAMLNRLLEYQDYFAIFGLVLRQFRQLILTRERIDFGETRQDVIRELKLEKTQFMADRLIRQARRFEMPDLENIYHRLLEIDQEVKTSQTPGDLALEMFVISITASQDSILQLH